MPKMKAPGVYIEEVPAFPNAVVQVATSVPAFIGYTERAQNGAIDLSNVPFRISSMAEYEALFGGPPRLRVVQDPNDTTKLVATNRFLMHASMKLFFNNGGGYCYIVSVGDYSATPSADDFIPGIDTLLTEQEPTMIVTPDAVLLATIDEHIKVPQAALAQCGKLENRITLIDIFDGDTAANDPIAMFRNKIGTNHLSYGVAYYPWLNTSVLDQSAVNYTTLDDKSRGALSVAMTAEAQKKADQDTGQTNAAIPDATSKLIATVAKGTDPHDVASTHQMMMSSSKVYKQTMIQALRALNLMPPSARSVLPPCFCGAGLTCRSTKDQF